MEEGKFKRGGIKPPPDHPKPNVVPMAQNKGEYSICDSEIEERLDITILGADEKKELLCNWKIYEGHEIYLMEDADHITDDQKFIREFWPKNEDGSYKYHRLANKIDDLKVGIVVLEFDRWSHVDGSPIMPEFKLPLNESIEYAKKEKYHHYYMLKIVKVEGNEAQVDFLQSRKNVIPGTLVFNKDDRHCWTHGSPHCYISDKCIEKMKSNKDEKET